MLIESEIETKAVEVFKTVMGYYASHMPGYIPRVYHINGVAFYLNPQGQGGEGGGARVYNPDEFNPLDPAHIEAWQIMVKIYKFMMAFETLLICGGRESFFDGVNDTSHDIERAIAYASTVFASPMYQYLPEVFQSLLCDALDVYKTAHEAMLALEAEMCLEVIRNSPKRGYVYLLESTVGYWKIGKSGVPVQRIGRLGVQLPFEIDVEALVETADMHELEDRLHKKYETKRVRGEWFSLAPEDIAYIKSLAVQA